MKSTISRNRTVRRLVLITSGLLAIGIASTISASPNAVYAAYGIELANNTSLINELKAPAGVLFFAGLIMIAGAFRVELSFAALVTAASIYLAYGSSRLLSIAVDGVPHGALVSAAAFEIIIGVVCTFVLLPELRNRYLPTKSKETGL